MSWLRARSQIAQVSGSTSSSAGSRLAIRPPTITLIATIGPNARVKSESRSAPDHGGVISSTSWPSDSSSAAASRAAAVQTGSSSASSSGGFSASPTRRRPWRRAGGVDR